MRASEQLSSSLALCCSHSTILVCKRRILDLFPKLETAVADIKTAEAGVMQMQMKRQKEFWFLLKIACVSIQTFLKDERESTQMSLKDTLMTAL